MSNEPSPYYYDFVVIGGGSGGYAAARTATDLGLRTAVIEGGADVGGLCILRGCMPSKTMIESANRFITLRRAKEFGLRAENIAVVGPEILARKRRLVGEFADYRRGQLEDGPFDFIRGRARFLGEHKLEVLPLEEKVDGEGGRHIESRTFLIATGSRISCLSTPGLAETGFLTSDETLELAEIPPSAIVLGAGAVGLEAAHHLAGLGCEVTVIQRGGHIMRGADADIAGALEKAMAAHGIRFFCGSHLLRAERESDGSKRVWFDRAGEKQSVAAREIICATGRRPATTGLETSRAEVDLLPNGSVPGTFAGLTRSSTSPSSKGNSPRATPPGTSANSAGRSRKWITD
jgi:pyruvate/2-oxoglutarate dehydrogenase complex dihydrolipoamide dehydrogenase (E3) component